MLFDLKAPFTADAGGDPAQGVRIFNAEGEHVLTAVNAFADRSDPVLLRAGLELAAPVAAVALASPLLLQAALMLLSSAVQTPQGLSLAAAPAESVERLRRAVSQALTPLEVPSAPALTSAKLALVS